MTATVEHVITDWTAEGQRPAGQPGTVNRNHRQPGWEYPAVRDDQGRTWYWRDATESAGRWIFAPGLLAESFIPGEDWQAECDHVHGVAYRVCDTEADCASLHREEAKRWGR